MHMPAGQVEDALQVRRYQDLLVDDAVAKAGRIAADLAHHDVVELFPRRIVPVAVAQAVRNVPPEHADDMLASRRDGGIERAWGQDPQIWARGHEAVPGRLECLLQLLQAFANRDGARVGRTK